MILLLFLKRGNIFLLFSYGSPGLKCFAILSVTQQKRKSMAYFFLTYAELGVAL